MTNNIENVKKYVRQAYNCFSQGNVQSAIAYFDTAVSHAPSCPDIYIERARFREKKLGDYQGALADYSQAIEINPHNPFFYYWRSEIYRQLGNHAQAIEDYNAGISLAPDHTIYYLFADG